MMTHEHVLKTWPLYFQAVRSRRKTFEIRRNDRHFETGDTLRLEEYDPQTETYTGRKLRARITYVYMGNEARVFGVDQWHVVMGIEVIDHLESFVRTCATVVMYSVISACSILAWEDAIDGWVEWLVFIGIGAVMGLGDILIDMWRRGR